MQNVLICQRIIGFEGSDRDLGPIEQYTLADSLFNAGSQIAMNDFCDWWLSFDLGRELVRCPYSV